MKLCEQNLGTICPDCAKKFVVEFERRGTGDMEFLCCDTYEEAKDVYSRIERYGQYDDIRVEKRSAVLLCPRGFKP